MENRHALVVDTRLTLATGTAEREAALEMVADRPGNLCLGSQGLPRQPLGSLSEGSQALRRARARPR